MSSSATTRAALVALYQSKLGTNTDGDIEASELREVIDCLVNSSAFILEDLGTSKVKDADQALPTIVGTASVLQLPVDVTAGRWSGELTLQMSIAAALDLTIGMSFPTHTSGNFSACSWESGSVVRATDLDTALTLSTVGGDDVIKICWGAVFTAAGQVTLNMGPAAPSIASSVLQGSSHIARPARPV